MNKRFVTVCIALTFFAAVPVFSVPLEELLEQEQAAALTGRKSPITEVQLKNPAPRLIPRSGELRQIVGGLMDNLQPSIFVETLYLYYKPQGSVPPVNGTPQWSDAERTALFNQLLSISTLTGIQYYSASRKTMRTFYESSWVLDSPESKKQQDDPTFTEVPPSFSFFARQKDLTFGDNIYRYDCRADAGAFFLVQENITPMNAGIIPAIGKGKFRMVMAVIDAGDSLLVYAAALAKTATVPGMGERVGNSFTNRAEALLKWFGSRADAVFQQGN